MTTISLSTKINAPIHNVFNLNRNIDVHKLSASKSKETAIDGITSGLINLNETVTWRGKHFGLYLTHKSIISAMQIPNYFIDEMVEDHFKSFKHQHAFRELDGVTVMEDTIQYETPFGFIFDKLILKNYLKFFINKRNHFIKYQAEKHDDENN